MFTSPTIHFPCGHLPTIYIIIHVMNSYRSHMTNMTYCAHCSKPYILQDILYICIHICVCYHIIRLMHKLCMESNGIQHNEFNVKVIENWCETLSKYHWNADTEPDSVWTFQTHIHQKKIVKLKWKRLKLKCVQPMNEKVTLFYNGIQSISLCKHAII